MPSTLVTKAAESICQKHRMALGAPQGEGAFKFVYCIHHGTDEFALKISKDSSGRIRTLRELQAIERCDHESIARLIHAGEVVVEGTTLEYSIEELLQGDSLATRLENGSTLHDDQIRRIGAALIEVLGHLHHLGLVHRDIKPDNIMFRDEGWSPVLVDFGLVRNLADTSVTKTWADRGPGTPYFSAPEQLNNNKQLIGWRTDQFSLGVVLTIARYGAHPYQESDEPAYRPATIERVGQQTQPAKWFLGLDNARILQKMVSPWPVQRYRTPKTLLDEWNARSYE